MIHPRPQCKCAKLIPNQLRDLQVALNLAFVDNSCNLGDVEAKHAVSIGILTKFLASAYFKISFLGRKARKQLKIATCGMSRSPLVVPRIKCLMELLWHSTLISVTVF